jgi:putative membrane protein
MWPVILVCGLAALVWGLLRARSSGGSGGQPPAPPPGDGRERARDILRERFARGEISEDELHDRMQALDGT